jgi:hypothetical protein
MIMEADDLLQGQRKACVMHLLARSKSDVIYRAIDEHGSELVHYQTRVLIDDDLTQTIRGLKDSYPKAVRITVDLALPLK